MCVNCGSSNCSSCNDCKSNEIMSGFTSGLIWDGGDITIGGNTFSNGSTLNDIIIAMTGGSSSLNSEVYYGSGQFLLPEGGNEILLDTVNLEAGDYMVHLTLLTNSTNGSATTKVYGLYLENNSVYSNSSTYQDLNGIPMYAITTNDSQSNYLDNGSATYKFTLASANSVYLYFIGTGPDVNALWSCRIEKV